jgi:hypothetical protein
MGALGLCGRSPRCSPEPTGLRGRTRVPPRWLARTSPTRTCTARSSTAQTCRHASARPHGAALSSGWLARLLGLPDRRARRCFFGNPSWPQLATPWGPGSPKSRALGIPLNTRLATGVDLSFFLSTPWGHHCAPVTAGLPWRLPRAQGANFENSILTGSSFGKDENGVWANLKVRRTGPAVLFAAFKGPSASHAAGHSPGCAGHRDASRLRRSRRDSLALRRRSKSGV